LSGNSKLLFVGAFDYSNRLHVEDPIPHPRLDCRREARGLACAPLSVGEARRRDGAEASSRSAWPVGFPVHRLDRPTSGVLLFALSNEAASVLAQKFQNEEVEKTYYAVVRGWLPSGPQTFEQELRKVTRAKKYDGEYQRAVTDYEVAESYELPFSTHADHPTSRYSLVRVHPKTGRWHQIRRHFAMASHPLVGDTVYGAGVHNRLFREKLGAHRLFLHCAEMSFFEGAERKTLSSELPQEFRERLHEYRVESPSEH
jgi:tRNA pseudouridine65 synthase